jgi:hypothetical protein
MSVGLALREATAHAPQRVDVPVVPGWSPAQPSSIQRRLLLQPRRQPRFLLRAEVIWGSPRPGRPDPSRSSWSAVRRPGA